MIRNSLAYTLLLFAIGLFQACTPSVNSKIYQAGAPVDEQFQDTLSFEFREGFIVVRAQLNQQSMPLDFIWDSGAPVTTISEATRQFLGMPETVETGALTKLNTLRLGNISFPSIPVKVVDYKGYAAPKCIAEAGVIGANIIRHCNWYIDFDEQLLILSNQPVKGNGTQVHTLPFKSTPFGQPELRIETSETGKAKVIAGIGHKGGVRISAKQLPEQGAMIYDRGILDPFASDVDTAVIFPNTDLATGSLSWKDALKVQVGRQAQIGNQLWSQYNVALNAQEATITLYPRATSHQPAPSLPQLGWMPHFTPTSDLSVGFIVVGSPAWEAGLRMGDIIDQIDRRAAPGWYNDYCAYLSTVQSQFGAPTQMQVFKNGSKQPVSVMVKGAPGK